MKQTTDVNRQIKLISRPIGAPKSTDFRIEENPVPIAKENEVLLRTIYLSLDPYMRGRMSDSDSYAAPIELGGVVVGGSVCRVEQSQHKDFTEGDLVVAFGGWQDFFISNTQGLIRLNKDMQNPSYALGIMGMPGFTAYMGLMDIGKPKAGETVVVAGVTGAVGSIVAQLAKLQGCRVVGVAGGEEKCEYALKTLKIDSCINHRSESFARDLELACNKGIDIYYENVGGAVFDAVMPLLNTQARIPLCGLISQYNRTELPAGPDRLSSLMGLILTKRIKVQGFIVFDDYAHRYNEFIDKMGELIELGKMTYKEDIVDGLENSIEAFQGLLVGKNFGKLVVKVDRNFKN